MYYFIIDYSKNMILGIIDSAKYDSYIANDVSLENLFDCKTIRTFSVSEDFVLSFIFELQLVFDNFINQLLST